MEFHFPMSPSRPRSTRQLALLWLLGLGCLAVADAQVIRTKLDLVGLLEGSQFLAPATLQLQAFASDPDGVSKVEFFDGDNLLGEGTLNGLIYTLDVPEVGVGSYQISVKSTDGTGKTKVTEATQITVREGKVYGSPGAVTPVPYLTSSSPFGYNEYLPDGYDPDDDTKQWPLVISLHGAGGQPGENSVTGEENIHNLDQALEGVIQAIQMDGIKLPAVVLQPQTGRVWNGNARLDKFITYALGQYNVDPGRVYLTGHSWGANIGALTYAGKLTGGNPNADRLAALFPMCGGQYSSTQEGGLLMAHLPMWNFASWGDHVGGSSGTINAVTYAAGGITYQDEIEARAIDPDIVVPVRDLLFSFSTVGREVFNNKVDVVTNTVDPADIASMSVPAFIPVKGDKIDATRTVSFVDGEWVWNEDHERAPNSRLFLTLLPGDEHIVWRDAYGRSDLWTWVFEQTRTPAPRSIFVAERFSTTPAVVLEAYVESLASKVTAVSGATFTRDATGPAWLQVAGDGTLSGTPGLTDTGLNTWEITVTTFDAGGVPATETAELLIMVETPGYNGWWQKQNGYPELNIPEIQTGPAGDDDGDGHSNYFEYVVGTDPLLATSRFAVSILPASEDPSELEVTFGPLVKGQTYIVKASASLTPATWFPVETSTPNRSLESETVTIVPSTDSARFYTVEIIKP